MTNPAWQRTQVSRRTTQTRCDVDCCHHRLTTTTVRHTGKHTSDSNKFLRFFQRRVRGPQHRLLRVGTELDLCLRYDFVLSPERWSARMSKITNDSLTRSGTGCFTAVPLWQQWAPKSKSGDCQFPSYAHTLIPTITLETPHCMSLP